MTDRYDVAVVGLGAWGSAAAWQLARRGRSVLGLEQFEFGHVRGASHDSSRILRRSYHTPGYVALAGEAYRDWADLEAVTGERFVTVTGGLDLFPPGSATPVADYAGSMDATGVPYAVLDAAAVRRRWPQFQPPDGTVALHQRDTGIVPAARGVAAFQHQARSAGAELREHCRVTGLVDGGVRLADGSVISAGHTVVCADAWTNRLLGERLPLTVTQEQVSYFQPAAPAGFVPDRFPVWIWMDDPCFYGFPTYGAETVKFAEDCGGREVSAETRSFDADPAALRRLTEFTARVLPSAGPAVRTVTCLYTLPPDRDFVLGPLPDRPDVLVGLGAGHGFKFAPTAGRLLAELVTAGATATDLSAYAVDRPALRNPDSDRHWRI